MKIILLKDVTKVGQKYDVKDVAAGYANNYLIPNNLAEVATKTKLKSVEELHVKRETGLRVQEELLAKNLDSLSNVVITISAKANEKGSLFKGIHTEEIVEALKEQLKIDMLPSMIALSDPIKEVGEFDIDAKDGAKVVTFKLKIEGM